MDPKPKINQTYVILRVRKGRRGYSSLRNAALRVSPVLVHQRLLSSFTHTVPFDFQFSWTFLGSDLKRFQSKCKDIRIEVWAKRARRHFIIGYAYLPIIESENLHQNAKLFKRRLTLVSKITDGVGIICPEIIVSLTTQTTLPEYTFNEVCRKDELYWLKYGPESKADYISDSSDHLEDVDSADDKKSEINTDYSSDVDDNSDVLESHLEEKWKASDKQKKPTPDDEIKSLKSDEIPSIIPLLRSQNSELLPAPQETNDSIDDLTMKFEQWFKAQVAEYLEEKSATNTDDSEGTKEIANTTSGQKYDEASSDSEEDFWGTKTNTKKNKQSKGGKGIERSTENPIRTTTNLTTSIGQSIKEKHTDKTAATLKLNETLAASFTSSEPDSILNEKPYDILIRLAAIRRNTLQSNNLEEKPVECGKRSVEQAASSVKLPMSSKESSAASVNKNKLVTNTMHVTNDVKEKPSNKNDACAEMSVKTTQKSNLFKLDGRRNTMKLLDIEEVIPPYEGELPMDEPLATPYSENSVDEDIQYLKSLYNPVELEKAFATMEYPNYPGKRCVLHLSTIKEEGSNDEMEEEGDDDVEFHQ